MIRVNLIPTPRRQAAARRRRWHRWVVVWLVFAGVVLGACELCRRASREERKAFDQGIRATTDQINQASSSIQKLCQELSQAQWQLECSQEVGRQPNWSVPLALIARDLGDEAVLQQCRLEPAVGASADSPSRDSAGRSGRFVLAVSGLGRSQAAVSGFVLRLEKSQLFERVRLIQTRREPFFSDNAVAFRLECLLAGPGGRRR